MIPATLPASKEVYGHWAVILLTLLAATLFLAVFLSPRPEAPRREPSRFTLVMRKAGDGDFAAAFPRILLQGSGEDAP